MRGMDRDTNAHVTIAGKNGGTLTPFNSERARLAQAAGVQARRNRAMRAAQSRTVQRLAASDSTIVTWADAWGELVADQAEALRQSASEGKPRGDDLQRVGQALGAMPLSVDRQEAEQSSITNNILAIGSDAAAQIMDALKRIATAQQLHAGDEAE